MLIFTVNLLLLLYSLLAYFCGTGTQIDRPKRSVRQPELSAKLHSDGAGKRNSGILGKKPDTPKTRRTAEFTQHQG